MRRRSTSGKQAAVELRVEGLHKVLDGQPVLQGVDLEVNRGDLLALIGGSGAGKSVLLSHFLGILTPDRGRLFAVDHGSPGLPLRNLGDLEADDLERIYAHWGVVFQRNALFSGTVYDNIALWLREVRGLRDREIIDVAKGVLAAVGLPTNDAFLARHSERLSGGMAKRLAVARSLAMEPAVMFYDEPTTGLDPTTAASIQDLILATHRNEVGQGVSRTSFIITHDKDLLRRLRPRTVLLYQGRVEFDGTYSQLRASDSIYVRPYLRMMPVLHQRLREAQ